MPCKRGQHTPKEAMNSPTYHVAPTRRAPLPTLREESIMHSLRTSRRGIGKSGCSDSSGSASKWRVTPPLSKKELAMALGGIDLQFSLPLPQPMENPKRRSRVVRRGSISSSSHPESCSPLPILSEQKPYCYRPVLRESLPQAMPWLQPSASTPSMEKCSSLLDNFLTTAEERMFLRNMMPMTPSMQRCSNLLDNLLTTAEERTLLRNMMPRTAFPSETSNMQPEVERSLEDPKCTPLLVASSQVEYNPFMIGVPNAPEDEFLVF